MFENLLKDCHKHGDFSKFPVGSLARVDCCMQDFYFFNKKEEGIVIKNTGNYLGIILYFTNIERVFDWGVQEKFNFNADDLVLIASPDVASLKKAIKLQNKFYPPEKQVKKCEHCGSKI